MLKFHSRVVRGEPILDTMYRFLRPDVHGAFGYKVWVRYPCCGAKRTLATLDEQDYVRCLNCGKTCADPRHAPLMQERDMEHAAFTKVSRYVS